MLSFLVGALLFVGCQANPLPNLFSFSASVGRGSGSSFSTEPACITGVRLWEVNGGSYVSGLQLRYGETWGEVIGVENDFIQELLLRDYEFIVQVSGKYDSRIHSLGLLTSTGRFLSAGTPTRFSFSMFPVYEGAVLILLSGRVDSSGLTSIAAHWGAAEEKPTPPIFIKEG